MSLEKDFQSLESKLTFFNYRLSFRAHKENIYHSKHQLDSLPNTYLTFHSIGLTESHKTQSMKSISALGTCYTNGAVTTSPRGGELTDSYTNAELTTFTQSTYSSLA